MHGSEAVDELPVDDVGADTADRYRYQAELATRLAVDALCGDDVERIICEWHEDYFVQYRDGQSELISVKHREAGQPPWTVRQIFEVGGLAHLFDRWRRTGRTSNCRLQTNSGMRSGEGECAGLQAACARGGSALDDWTEEVRVRLCLHLPEDAAPTDDEVRQFLESLKIESDLPDRHHIRDVNIRRLGPRISAAFALVNLDDATYDRVVGVVEAASRADGREIVLEFLGSPSSLTHENRVLAAIAAKTVDGSTIRAAISTPIPGPALSTAGVPTGETLTSRLRLKLEAGGFRETACGSARVLQYNWHGYRARWSSGLLVSPIVEDVEARVLAAAARAEIAADPGVADTRYGLAMHAALVGEILTELDRREDTSLDADLLWGCVYELTDRCEIWWSDRFEISS